MRSASDAIHGDVCGVHPADVVILFNPADHDRREAARLLRQALVRWDDQREELRRTQAGGIIAGEIVDHYGLGWDAGEPGGGRHTLGGSGLRCGEPLELLTARGEWLPVRWEVEHRRAELCMCREEPHPTLGPGNPWPNCATCLGVGSIPAVRPVLYLATSGPSLRCSTDYPRQLVLRRPTHARDLAESARGAARAY